jgi:hypothetical protein
MNWKKWAKKVGEWLLQKAAEEAIEQATKRVRK